MAVVIPASGHAPRNPAVHLHQAARVPVSMILVDMRSERPDFLVFTLFMRAGLNRNSRQESGRPGKAGEKHGNEAFPHAICP